MELWAVSSDRGGAEGTEWASGQHLRCKHRQDHGKSSHTSLTTNTYLLIEPGQENCLFLQSMKWFSRLLPAWALPCCQCSGSSYREQTRLLKQGGYKNCYSWGQILYFYRQAQTWWTSNKLQQWLLVLSFSKIVVSLYPRNPVPASVLAWVHMWNVSPSPRPCFYIHFSATWTHQPLRRCDSLLSCTLLPACLFSMCLWLMRSCWADITWCKVLILHPQLIRTLDGGDTSFQLSHKDGLLVCF